MRSLKVYFLLPVFGVLFFVTALAENKTNVNLPDLSVHSVVFDPPSKDGEPIGVVKILVHNHGTADAPKNKLKFECLATDCDDDLDCLRISEALKGTIDVPPIKKDGEVELRCAPYKPMAWVKGNYIVSAIIDPENQVLEASEVNNINRAVVYLKQFSPETR
ncbi:MAG: hypothetical protein MUC39_02640 [Candidatus Omnitrophica bacterium]|jgi:hypothetical protein|nr:hypothetical protein [Candidatus Omnitrophota bacterium]